MTLVRNQITNAENVGTPGWVMVRLVGPGLRPATQTEILGQQSDQTEADGSWELELPPNTPEAPYYVIAEQAGDFFTRQHVISVPDSLTPVWLGDITVQVPLPVGRADAVYAGPPGPPGPPGPDGLGAVDSVNGIPPVSGNVALDADDIPDGSAQVMMSASERTKLGTVSSGATANATDEELRDRALHTGEQEISTVTGLQVALDNKVNSDDLTASIMATITTWTPLDYRYDNAYRAPGTGTMPRPNTARPVHWYVPAAFTLPNTGTTAGATTASVPGLDVVHRYS